VGLDPLGDGFHAEPLGHGEDRADEPSVLPQAMYERLVDLDDVDGELLKVGE
jgi:hypothetical protein